MEEFCRTIKPLAKYCKCYSTNEWICTIRIIPLCKFSEWHASVALFVHFPEFEHILDKHTLSLPPENLFPHLLLPIHIQLAPFFNSLTSVRFFEIKKGESYLFYFFQLCLLITRNAHFSPISQFTPKSFYDFTHVWQNKFADFCIFFAFFLRY